MTVEEVPEIVKEADKEFPHFEDGRIDYSDAEKSPIVVLFLKHDDEILTLKRSRKVDTHPERWGLVAGYLDELKPIKKKGLEELAEETGIERDQVASVRRKGVYDWQSEEEDRKYRAFLLLVELEEKPSVDLSWEHEEYKWIRIEQADRYLSSNAVKELEIALS